VDFVCPAETARMISKPKSWKAVTMPRQELFPTPIKEVMRINHKKKPAQNIQLFKSTKTRI
jgi:hypothetical protein